MFTGSKKCEIWCRLQHPSILSRLCLNMQHQDIWTLKQTSCVGIIALCPLQVSWSWVHAHQRTVWNKNAMPRWTPYVLVKSGEVGSTHPWESSHCFAPPPNIALRKRAKSSTTERWIISFRSNFVQSLNVWHPKCCKSSRSRGQRSSSRRDITCAKILKIIYNSAGDCSISLVFRAHFDYLMFDVPRTVKVNRSKIKVTARHNVPAL